MPPQKPEPEQAARSHYSAQDDTHQVLSRPVRPESAAGYNDPATVTVSRASASPRSDAAALTIESPIRSLSSDVLAEIFILTMHTDWAELHHPKSSLKPNEGESQRKMLNPLALCAVCSSWRYLAFSVPKLWRKVFVHIPIGMSADGAKSKAADLVQWIKRSRLIPLTLHIFYDVSVPLDGIGPGAPIVSVFTDYATHWEAVYFQPTGDQRGSEPQGSAMFCFDGWDSLRRLCSTDLRCQFSENKTIPWAQLTHLQIYVLTILEGRTVLKECPKLVQLSIGIYSLRSRWMAASVIVMHNLVSLSLSSSPASDILHELVLPSLRDIYICNVWKYGLSDLLTRSSCALDKLEISASNFEPGDLLHILAHRSCDLLTSLKIHESSFSSNVLVDNKVLERLTLDRDDSLCPNLRFLTVDCCTKYSVSALFKMLESRISSSDGQAPDKPLQYLHFRVDHPEYKLDKLDKFGERCGMMYDRQRRHFNQRVYGTYYHPDHSYSIVSFQRQDLSGTQLQSNHGGFCFDQD